MRFIKLWKICIEDATWKLYHYYLVFCDSWKDWLKYAWNWWSNLVQSYSLVFIQIVLLLILFLILRSIWKKREVYHL